MEQNKRLTTDAGFASSSLKGFQDCVPKTKEGSGNTKKMLAFLEKNKEFGQKKLDKAAQMYFDTRSPSTVSKDFPA